MLRRHSPNQLFFFDESNVCTICTQTNKIHCIYTRTTFALSLFKFCTTSISIHLQLWCERHFALPIATHALNMTRNSFFTFRNCWTIHVIFCVVVFLQRNLRIFLLRNTHRKKTYRRTTIDEPIITRVTPIFFELAEKAHSRKFSYILYSVNKGSKTKCVNENSDFFYSLLVAHKHRTQSKRKSLMIICWSLKEKYEIWQSSTGWKKIKSLINSENKSTFSLPSCESKISFDTLFSYLANC